MSWKRDLAEIAVLCAHLAAPANSSPPIKPSSIFVLRNNDIGDLLVITPLFQALHELFPEAEIVAGIGDWNRDVLELNPYVSKVISVNAPWHNQVIVNQTPQDALSYILFSEESQRLKELRFDIGIDVVGSHFGSLLLINAGIPFRLGVHGYAGGHTGVQAYVEYNHHEHVGKSALRFAELLGATKLPPVKPQIFLRQSELADAGKLWTPGLKHVLIGPGGGFATKCWSPYNYVSLVSELSKQPGVEIIIAGGLKEKAFGETLRDQGTSVRNVAGSLSLRQSFALTALSDVVICNSSMLMHAAAAFDIPHVVTLGEYFSSAEQHMDQWGYPGLSHCFTQTKEVLDTTKGLISRGGRQA